MKYFVFILIFCGLFGGNILAQPNKETALFRIWDANGKEGFIDADGKAVVKPQFDSVMDFSEGLAAVLVNGKWGYINQKGAIIIQPRWQQRETGWERFANPFREGLAAVVEAVKWDVRYDSNYHTYKCGYINKTGEYVIQPKYRQSCEPFNDGLALIKLDYDDPEYPKDRGWYGYLDKTGKWAIKPGFFSASHFREGYALVQSEPLPKDLYIKLDNSDLVVNNPNRKSLYLIDKTGQRAALDVKDCGWRYSFSEGLGLAFSETEKMSAGFINENCESVFKLPPDVKTESYFSEGLLVVSKETKGKKLFGYINRNGKTEIDFKFAGASLFSDGLAGVTIEEKGKTYQAYINHKGEIVINNTRGNSLFKYGLAYHHLFTWTISERPTGRNIYGYMNKQGKYVWLSPRAEIHLGADWIRENFAGQTSN